METPEHLARLRVVGGHLALDFLNTRSGPPGGPFDVEGLRGYEDLVAWAVRAGTLSEAAARRLVNAARRRPSEAQAALQLALALRDELHGVFVAIAAGDPPPAFALEAVRRAELDGLAGAELAPVEAGAAWTWTWARDERLTRPIWPAVHAAVELLGKGPLDRVKGCGGCSFLFLDDSKNRSRRWCSMDDCGTAEKMRRFVARRRTLRSS